MSDPSRNLDFSNVGAELTFGAPLPQPPIANNTSDIEDAEHHATRIRGEDTFALGIPNPIGRPIHRHPTDQAERVQRPRIQNSNINTKFRPIDYDVYYNSHCRPGHIRIFKSLIGPTILAQNTFLYKDMPLNVFRNYTMNVVNPFYETSPTQTNSFAFVVPKDDRQYLIDIWNKNLEVRFQMRRLLSLWLTKKSRKNVKDIQNYTTLEDPNPLNSICWLDMNNRCTYRIDGDTLLKSISMYLANSCYGVPEPLWPKNPNTNIAFTFGQLLHIFFELYVWCGKNKKKVPFILTRFHDHGFSLEKFLLHNKPHLAYIASKDLFSDMGSEDAVDELMDCVENYGGLLTPINRSQYELLIPQWIAKIKEPADLALIKEWQSILPDILQHEQFKIFTRKEWKSAANITSSIKKLWSLTTASIHRIVRPRIAIKRPLPRLIENIVRSDAIVNSMVNTVSDLTVDLSGDIVNPPISPVSTETVEDSSPLPDVNDSATINSILSPLIENFHNDINNMIYQHQIEQMIQDAGLNNIIRFVVQVPSEEKEQESDEANV